MFAVLAAITGVVLGTYTYRQTNNLTMSIIAAAIGGSLIAQIEIALTKGL